MFYNIYWYIYFNNYHISCSYKIYNSALEMILKPFVVAWYSTAVLYFIAVIDILSGSKNVVK